MVKSEATFEAFAKSLSAEGDDDVSRAIVAGILAIAGGRIACFFDSHPSQRSFRAAQDTPGSAPFFSDRSALARWLRVNDEVLLVSEPGGPCEDLPETERETLKTLEASACIPLVCAGQLVAFVVLSAGPGHWEAPRHVTVELMRRARWAAIVWRNVQQRAFRRQEASASYRAQQLSTAGQLAAAIAHEVRNPLAIIRSLVQFTRDARPTLVEQDRLLNDVLAEVDRVDQTVEGFLRIGRPHESSPVQVDLGSLANETARFLAAYARRLRVEMVVNTPDGEIQVRIDPRELRQVFVNILLNACQACSSGGRVHLTVRRRIRDVGRAEVVIQDTGCGITESDLQHVLNPFFTTKPNGTGLGLSVCRETLERYGGSIDFESRMGVGTTVIVGLPLCEEHGTRPSR